MTREHTDSRLAARTAALLLTLLAAAGWVGCQQQAVEAAEVREPYLFKEYVERAGYFNNWSVTSIDSSAQQDESEQPSVLILAEGKTAEFRGVLSLGGPGGRPTWTGAENFGYALDAEQLERLVPVPVLDNAHARLRSR